MKNINRIIATVTSILLAFTMVACEKDDETANISRVTTYAEFDMSGDQFVSLVQGETFTDPGVTALEGETELDVTATGTVDTSTPGVYVITYSAVNSDNFPGTITRTVAVLPEPEQEGVNIAGTYVRNGVTSTVTKLAPGFYLMSNIYGSPLIAAYIITTNGTDLSLPEATLSPYGPLFGTGTLNNGVMRLVFSLPVQGIANRERIWERQ
ncbi:DUF5011 domain-containing protein [Pontibacter populi]|uniref:DUF5011 domain-containing protein n=1 Tax=Pontibacter populi TaxID=890055 RepID=A0ABV1RNS8_9BACT